MKRNPLFLLLLVVLWAAPLLATDVYYFQYTITFGGESDLDADKYLPQAESTLYEELKKLEINRTDIWIVSVQIAKKNEKDGFSVSYKFHVISFHPLKGVAALVNPRLEFVDGVSLQSVAEVALSPKDLVPRHWYPYLDAGIKRDSIPGVSYRSHESILASRWKGSHYLKVQFLADAREETLTVPIEGKLTLVTPWKAFGRRWDNGLFHCAQSMFVQNKDGRFEW